MCMLGRVARKTLSDDAYIIRSIDPRPPLDGIFEHIRLAMTSLPFQALVPMLFDGIASGVGIRGG